MTLWFRLRHDGRNLPEMRELDRRFPAPDATADRWLEPVPAILHQTFASFDALPKEFQAHIASIRRLNPEFDYRFYDDDAVVAFIRNVYGEVMLATYLSISARYGAPRADFFRYLCLYANGGVYLDIKADLKRPLREVIQESDRFILAQWDQDRFPGWGMDRRLQVPGGEYLQWFVISCPRHPYLRGVIQEVIYRIKAYTPLFDDIGRNAGIWVTGPLAFTKAISSIRDHHPHRLVRSVEKELGIHYTFLGDPYAHHGLHARRSGHYSHVKEPLVDAGAFSRFSAWLVAGLRDLLAFLRARFLPAR